MLKYIDSPVWREDIEKWSGYFAKEIIHIMKRIFLIKIDDCYKEDISAIEKNNYRFSLI